MEQIAPYRQIQQHDLLAKYDHTLLSKARFVMKTLVSYCPDNSTSAAVSRMSQSDLDALFDIVYICLCEKIYPGTAIETLDGRRVGDRSYVTIYDHVKKYNAL